MKALQEFINRYPAKKFAKGELILCEGEVPTCAYVVKKGIVKGYAITSEGLEKPISFDGIGEAFPIGWIFRKLRWSQYYFGAFTDCELHCIPRDEYLDYLKSHPEILQEVFDAFISRYLNFQMRINALEQSKAVDKILHTLHFLSLRFGKEIAPHTVRIQLPLTQQDLANIMGLTRETTGIELKKLEQQGIVTYRRQNYVVHTNRLNEVLDEEYDSGRIVEEPTSA
jgi:CRP/FNR family transcriptional regulator